MLLPRIFALILAVAVLATSILIYVMGARFQEIEKKAYLGEKRPWWFQVGLAAFAATYLTALAGFIMSDERNWAAWILMVVIPIVATLKLGLVILNEKGKERVTSIEGDLAWRRIAIARATLVPVFLALAYFI